MGITGIGSVQTYIYNSQTESCHPKMVPQMNLWTILMGHY